MTTMRARAATVLVVLAVATTSLPAAQAQEPEPEPEAEAAPEPAAQPTTEPSPAEPHKNRLFLLGYVGFQSFRGEFAADTSLLGLNVIELSAGPRFGGMIGYRVGAAFSLNAEATLDLPRADMRGEDNAIDAYRYALSASPLFHYDAGVLDFVAGPKIGYWASSFYDGDSLGSPRWSYSGWMVGLQVGAFYKVGHVGLGGILSYDDSHPTKECDSEYDIPTHCGSNQSMHDDRLLSLAAGVTF